MADERVARVRDTVTTLVNDLAFLFEVRGSRALSTCGMAQVIIFPQIPLGSPRIDPATGKYGLGSMFGHLLIQDISNKLFFKRGKSIPLGIKHKNLFSAGMTYSTIALISTAVSSLYPTNLFSPFTLDPMCDSRVCNWRVCQGQLYQLRLCR